MANYKVECEAVDVATGSTCQKVGDCFTIWKRTPAHMCCRAFDAVYPVSLTMRFSDRNEWDTDAGYQDVRCPDGNVVYRLSRIED